MRASSNWCVLSVCLALLDGGWVPKRVCARGMYSTLALRRLPMRLTFVVLDAYLLPRFRMVPPIWRDSLLSNESRL